MVRNIQLRQFFLEQITSLVLGKIFTLLRTGNSDTHLTTLQHEILPSSTGLTYCLLLLNVKLNVLSTDIRFGIFIS